MKLIMKYYVEIVHSDQLVDDYIYSLKLKQKNKIFNYNKKFDKMM